MAMYTKNPPIKPSGTYIPYSAIDQEKRLKERMINAKCDRVLKRLKEFDMVLSEIRTILNQKLHLRYGRNLQIMDQKYNLFYMFENDGKGCVYPIYEDTNVDVWAVRDFRSDMRTLGYVIDSVKNKKMSVIDEIFTKPESIKYLNAQYRFYVNVLVELGYDDVQK